MGRARVYAYVHEGVRRIDYDVDMMFRLSAPKSRRRPKNAAEGSFFDEVTAQGWDACKRGWPDFFCEKDGQIALVEVKPSGSKMLRSDQERVMKWLAGYGVPCYRWSPEDGYERIEP